MKRLSRISQIHRLQRPYSYSKARPLRLKKDYLLIYPLGTRDGEGLKALGKVPLLISLRDALSAFLHPLVGIVRISSLFTLYSPLGRSRSSILINLQVSTYL